MKLLAAADGSGGGVACGALGSATGSRRRRSSYLARPSGLPPSRMSVPRPAMLVEMVMAPPRPACATMSASRSTYCGRALRMTNSNESVSPGGSAPIRRAYSLSCSRGYKANACRRRATASLSSTVCVPTSTGLPLQCSAKISQTTSSSLTSWEEHSEVSQSRRTRSRLGGTVTTSSAYVSKNSTRSVAPVPVMPLRRPPYRLKRSWYVIEAAWCWSSCTSSPSFASTATCRLSVHRRPGVARPVYSSTMTTSLSRTMYCLSRR
mmetsp:Transcript_11542/g.48444  ORF Transcript_11542/g.48444 Transcript_11542/m.48444 type:complete len:264 (-) Transcript_11542:1613-2404(-)